MKNIIKPTPQLVNHFFQLVDAHAPICQQTRTFLRVKALLLAELFCFGRHRITDLLMTLGLATEDWTSWYRLFTTPRIDFEKAHQIMFQEVLTHVSDDELFVVAGDGTQTPRTGKKIEGTGFLRNFRTPAFMVGIHQAQRWFNGVWMTPLEQGYSRAIPLKWMPAFTQKSKRQQYDPLKEWEAAVKFLQWLKQNLTESGRQLTILMLGDGAYDTLGLWKELPDGVILLARSAKNRALYHMPTTKQRGRGRKRKYGEKAASPQERWRNSRKGWHTQTVCIRGKQRTFRTKVNGPFLRKGASDTPLFLFIIGGKQLPKHAKKRRIDPIPYLVNAIQNECGEWCCPLTHEQLLVWAWQRWEIEVVHRELKSNFGLGDKQCWTPTSAVTCVQWSAWAYGMMVLAGYRTWGLAGGPAPPARWWKGGQRWSFNTLWRTYRASLWGEHEFSPLWSHTSNNWPEKELLLHNLKHAAYASTQI